MPVTGIRSDPGDSGWQRELAETGALALPGERLPAAPPPVVSNTRASVAAYAEAVTDGVEDELRRRLFEAIWAQRRNLSGPYDVRGVIAEVMWPTDPIYFHLESPDLPDPILHDPDPMRIVCREGGTVTPDGGPLTTTGYRRIQQWRQRWLALPQQVIPAVVSRPAPPISALTGSASWPGSRVHPLSPGKPRQGCPAGTPRAYRYDGPGTTVPVCYMRASFLPAGVR